MEKKRLSAGIEKNEFLTQTFNGYYIQMDNFGACSFCAMGLAILSTGKLSISEMLDDKGEISQNILDLSYYNFDLDVELLDEIEAKFGLASKASKPLSYVMHSNYKKANLFALVMMLNDRYRISFKQIKEIVAYIEDQLLGVN